MVEIPELKREIKDAMVEELMLQQSAADLADDMQIFSPQGLGLDSVDALQLAVMLEKRFGLKLTNAEEARHIMQNVNTIAAAIASRQS